jgi:hypothetical protein
MYVVVEINEGGYIRPVNGYQWEDIIHLETVGLDRTCLTHERLADGAPLAYGKRALAELDEQGAVCALWAKEPATPWWQDKLKIWNGCYGSWPLRKLN